MSHSIRISNLREPKVINCGYGQPRWVHVSDTPKDLQESSVNFISMPYAALVQTNIMSFPDPSQYSLDLSIKIMLESNRLPHEVSIRNFSAREYVDMISKPSLLNNLQNLIYKIQPYSLRKEAQAMMLQFFSGRVSTYTAESFFKKSLKTAPIVKLLQGEGQSLRQAVIRTRSEPVEVVSESTGIATFDLLYLSKERVIKTANNKKNKKKVVVSKSFRDRVTESSHRRKVKF